LKGFDELNTFKGIGTPPLDGFSKSIELLKPADARLRTTKTKA